MINMLCFQNVFTSSDPKKMLSGIHKVQKVNSTQIFKTSNEINSVLVGHGGVWISICHTY